MGHLTDIVTYMTEKENWYCYQYPRFGLVIWLMNM